MVGTAETLAALRLVTMLWHWPRVRRLARLQQCPAGLRRLFRLLPAAWQQQQQQVAVPRRQQPQGASLSRPRARAP